VFLIYQVKLREWKLKLMVQDHNLWDRATIECHGPENGGQSEHIKPEEPILFADEKANSVRLEQPASQVGTWVLGDYECCLSVGTIAFVLS